MTALDERPTTAPAELHCGHPDSPGRRRETTRLGRCLPDWNGESVSFYALPTCDPGCTRELQSKVWIHSTRCDERCRDEAVYRKCCAEMAKLVLPGTGRVSAWDQRRIDYAEDTARGAHDPVWSERHEAQARVRRAAGDAA